MIYFIIAGVISISEAIVVLNAEFLSHFDKAEKICSLVGFIVLTFVILLFLGMTITFFSISERETELVAQDKLVPLTDDIYVIYDKSSSLFLTYYYISYNSSTENGIKMKKLSISSNVNFNFAENTPTISKYETKKILPTKMSFLKMRLENTIYDDIVIDTYYVVEIPEGSILYK